MLWDVFCAVVDNYGDIGVAWRLARQLRHERGERVRLWVDDLRTFSRLCRQVECAADVQIVQGVEVRRWTPGRDGPTVAIEPGDAVIELFGCHLPASFEQAMAARLPQPVWVNLEYLSAETWVEGCHRLVSTHPRLPLQKHFFFPGFSADSGGLLRESGLMDVRRQFDMNAAKRQAAESLFGLPQRQAGVLRLSLFCYDSAPLESWFGALRDSPGAIEVLIPDGVGGEAVTRFCDGARLSAGMQRQVGALTLRGVPFVEQPDHDLLLWLSDFNVVRGEDSFVRAQWAARPFLWHIYPQHDEVHLRKLGAFMERYTERLRPEAAAAISAMANAWNLAGDVRATWQALVPCLAELRSHGERWAEELSCQEDLLSQLVRFVGEQL
ncbi:MAG: elongation factor P maturation arginine rhamnosyltransferase EarP [Betaproteobacteria bacterium]|nr:elongation factor P maturation arginine rhamnosyltransferase EarP [Betaproteobacteria bacterium]